MKTFVAYLSVIAVVLLECSLPATQEEFTYLPVVDETKKSSDSRTVKCLGKFVIQFK